MNWETLLSFGDSITFGARSYLGYPELCGDILGKKLEKSWHVINHAVNGYTTIDLVRSIDPNLDNFRNCYPSIITVMIGTNDISGGKVPEGYREGLQKVIDKCVAARCIPILNTIPPKRGAMKAVEEANGIIRELATKNQVPLVDYYGEILKRRPGESWDGTLIDADGVHPTAGETGKFDEANLAKSGYALRNWTNFLMYREIYFTVLSPTSGR